MTRMLQKFINNKYFYLWSLLLIMILYMFYVFFKAGISNYMLFNGIENKMYIFYAYTLPMTFSNANYIFCILLDLLYITILLYPSVTLVDYFFNQNSTTSITRIKRKKWINQFMNINLICSAIISIIYILLFFILGELHNSEIVLEFETFNNFLPILYKILISLIIPLAYIYIYIKTDNPGLSVGFIIFINALLQTIIKITFDVKKIYFYQYVYVICLFIVLYMLIRILCIKSFKRRDV